MNFWFDLQRNMMKSWFDLGQPAAPSNPFANGLHTNGGYKNPWVDAATWAPWNALFGQQLKQMQSFWSGGRSAVPGWFDVDMAESARRTSEKMLESQMVVLKMFENMAQSWAAASQTGQLADWQAEFAKQMEAQLTQMRSQWDATAERMNELTQSSNQMWQVYIEQLQQSSMPWLTAWLSSAEESSAWLRNGGAHQVNPTNLMGHFWKAYEETFGQMVASPPLGLTREQNLELTKGFETWLAYRRADAEYQRIVSNGWLHFLEAFGKRLAQMAQEGKLIESPRQFVDLWVEVGDEEFTKLFHSDLYAQAQGALVNSSMAFKRQQRTLLEIWLRNNDMPTRSDLDEAHQIIYELRKEVKTLKKELRTLQQLVAAAPAAPTSPTSEAPNTEQPTVAKSTAKPNTAKAAAAVPKRATKARASRQSGSTASTNRDHP